MEHSIELTLENAQHVIFEQSSQKLVLVYFWSQTCSHCVTLGPLLDRISAEFSGQLILAKVNCDEQPNLPAQFGVRSLPTVMLIKDAQPVDGFAGAQPESEIRAFLEKHLPKPYDLQLVEAKTLLADENYGAAQPLLKTAYQDSGERADIGIQYALALLGLKRLDEAEAIIDSIKLADQDSEYAKAKAQLELAKEAGKSPAIEALEQELERDPQNAELAYQLAVQYAQHHYTKEALELLYGLLSQSLSSLDGKARAAYTDILNSLEKGDTLASEYQRKLYTLLY